MRRAILGSSSTMTMMADACISSSTRKGKGKEPPHTPHNAESNSSPIRSPCTVNIGLESLLSDEIDQPTNASTLQQLSSSCPTSDESILSQRSSATTSTSLTAITSLDSTPMTKVDPYRRPFKSSRCGRGEDNINIYPCSFSQVPEKYKSQFSDILPILKKNINKEPDLGPRSGDITYRLLMCGPSTSNLKAAIVVACHMEIVARVQKVLTGKALLKRCDLCCLSTNQTNLFSRFRAPDRPGLVNSEDSRLGIEFYGCGSFKKESQVRIQLHGPSGNDSKQVILPSEQRSTLSGSRVTTINDGGSATITCIIKVGDALFGLTAAHTFHKSIFRGTESETASRKRRNLVKTKTKNPWNLPGACFVAVSGRISLGSPGETFNTLVWMPSDKYLSDDQPDLDWALFELGHEKLFMDNVCMSNDLISTHIAINVVAENHPGMETEVMILTTNGTTRRGVLLQGATQCTRNGLTVGEVWSIELENDQSLQKGDSGALVVDAENKSLCYGYIISLDAFGQAQMIPLNHTLAQVSDLTREENVSLASSAEVAYKRRCFQEACQTPSISTQSSSQSHNIHQTRTLQPVSQPKEDVLAQKTAGLAFKRHSEPNHDLVKTQREKIAVPTAIRTYVGYVLKPNLLSDGTPYWATISCEHIGKTQAELAKFVGDHRNKASHVYKNLDVVKRRHIDDLLLEHNGARRYEEREWKIAGIELRKQAVADMLSLITSNNLFVVSITVILQQEGKSDDQDDLKKVKTGQPYSMQASECPFPPPQFISLPGVNMFSHVPIGAERYSCGETNFEHLDHIIGKPPTPPPVPRPFMYDSPYVPIVPPSQRTVLLSPQTLLEPQTHESFLALRRSIRFGYSGGSSPYDVHRRTYDAISQRNKSKSRERSPEFDILPLRRRPKRTDSLSKSSERSVLCGSDTASYPDTAITSLSSSPFSHSRDSHLSGRSSRKSSANSASECSTNSYQSRSNKDWASRLSPASNHRRLPRGSNERGERALIREMEALKIAEHERKLEARIDPIHRRNVDERVR